MILDSQFTKIIIFLLLQFLQVQNKLHHRKQHYPMANTDENIYMNIYFPMQILYQHYTTCTALAFLWQDRCNIYHAIYYTCTELARKCHVLYVQHALHNATCITARMFRLRYPSPWTRTLSDGGRVRNARDFRIFPWVCVSFQMFADITHSRFHDNCHICQIVYHWSWHHIYMYFTLSLSLCSFSFFFTYPLSFLSPLSISLLFSPSCYFFHEGKWVCLH